MPWMTKIDYNTISKQFGDVDCNIEFVRSNYWAMSKVLDKILQRVEKLEEYLGVTYVTADKTLPKYVKKEVKDE